MSEGDLFKYDVRVRERMLRRGSITEAEIHSRLDALPDRTGDIETINAAQPALGREDRSRSSRPSEIQAAPLTPPMARAPVAEPPEADIDDDEDDDDDTDTEALAPDARPAVAAAVREEELAAAPPAVAAAPIPAPPAVAAAPIPAPPAVAAAPIPAPPAASAEPAASAAPAEPAPAEEAQAKDDSIDDDGWGADS